MSKLPYLANRGAVADAASLMSTHGPDAAFEAALRADRSRSIGNYIHFCRWRQIERLVRLLETDYPHGTVH
ncbi:hypothetical protein [Sphingomonas radiodurans]|uniref:hypothetical protein n=1 Tax=Sphingomonas radiodurans TaxID=2890321 RepID=UPI001E31CA30|nr:hypothetical protein [Sphingomonas radiodurans]WBH17251.1 hypothetical protein LLW23_03845 [Sphingomonas radiodurans]